MCVGRVTVKFKNVETIYDSITICNPSLIYLHSDAINQSRLGCCPQSASALQPSFILIGLCVSQIETKEAFATGTT